MFVVATAPLAGDGYVNASPTGYNTPSILDEHTLAIHAERISGSCGYSVPRYEFVEERRLH